jgi:uncharacterized protein
MGISQGQRGIVLPHRASGSNRVAAAIMPGMNKPTDDEIELRTEIEARVLRKLLEHLRAHPEVQNLDLMNLAYFCRNCLSKWYAGAAGELGVEMDYEQAREIVYGMPYAEYKRRHQQEASPEKLERFAEAERKATP